MIALALLASLLVQDTNTVISPRVHALIDRFPPPHSGLPSIAIRYSRDTVWLGEQVELVTATWFPRSLRHRLPLQPGISAPTLTGVWIARNQQQPILAATRTVDGEPYDLFLSWQSVFPLGPGKLNAPPATLTYNLPTSTAYFAPQEKKTFLSTPAALVVRALPPAAGAAVGNGPTAHNMKASWRVPAATMRAGAPQVVELVVSGEGNLTLWPAPAIEWPVGLHVYPEPTIERQVPAQGLITGEKRFRFTIVADSAGVITLPSVRYPYFDPEQVQVVPVSAAAVTLPILLRENAPSDRRAMVVTGAADVPFASVVIRQWWPVVAGLALLPLVLIAVRDRRRAAPVPSIRWGNAEAELRAALGTPVDAGQDHVIAALRMRGVPRDEAEHVHRWLSAVGRRRYGPAKGEQPEPPPVISQVIARLRGPATFALLLLVTIPLFAQRSDAVARFAGGDYAGSARAFAQDAAETPIAAGSWRDLGAARWMAREDVSAAAAWLTALGLAPRDALLRNDWAAATTVPADIRGHAPSIPASRDELLLVVLVAWLITGTAIAYRWRRVGLATALLCGGALLLAVLRWHDERPGSGLVTESIPLRISPHPATAAVGQLAAWSLIRVERRLGNWLLVDGQLATAGSVAGLTVQGWIPATAVASIGPLD